ncbi:hypothetical protein C1H46_044734 [Malus baccata]|uniref:STICHEL DnaA-N-like alpha-beta domain-containing protein n=1 Tax=Malus baccata TaxID=106549 RepID=A0A540K763_MALBA|nr:hypothetical protein C1H46_044734 [Malus baccata]
MEKLRQALKTLSEAEKQLRMSNDKLTWLTAALLQLAPDQQYMLPSSSGNASFHHSPLALNNVGGRSAVRKDSEQGGMPNYEKGLPTNVRNSVSSGKGMISDRKRHAASGMASQQTATGSAEMVRVKGKQIHGKSHKGIEEVWLEVLEKIPYNRIKEFLYQEGKLTSVSFGAAPTAQLMFSSHMTKSTAEKFRTQILQAFEIVLGSPLTIEIRCESKRNSKEWAQMPIIIPASKDGSSHIRDENAVTTDAQLVAHDTCEMGTSEIVEVAASPRETKGGGQMHNQKKSTMAIIPEKQQSQNQSIVRSKVSLAHVIQQSESQRSGWSQRKAVSIAEKLEQDNLRLESRSRSLLCWKASRVTRRRLSRLKIRARRPHSLLKLVSCGKCLSSRSPRVA